MALLVWAGLYNKYYVAIMGEAIPWFFVSPST